MSWDGGDESRVQALMAENAELREEMRMGVVVAELEAEVERLREALLAIETDYGVEDPQLTTYIRSVLDA